ASPRPIEIMEKEAIRDLSASGYLVVAAGGGGIPVVKNREGLYSGIEAVIDKDYASALLALEIDADLLIILTGVEKVSINFGKHNQENLDVMDVQTARKHMSDGQFPPGSMGPKIDAALSFVETTGGTALITSIDELKRAVKGETGTRIVKY
ncbi:MAG TPA: carbamate kinase, partial [Proteiniclasticum sp.]|nr:carbamate kinase [Proteiniclasticum sp.]